MYKQILVPVDGSETSNHALAELIKLAREQHATLAIVMARSDRLAGVAVQLPPALPVFPANREFYREFCKIAASGAPETAINGVVTGLPMRIPYSTEQGIILAEQGILAREQGIL